MSPRTEVEIKTQNNTSITASALTQSWYQIHEGETTNVNLWFEQYANSDSISFTESDPDELTVSSGETYTVSTGETESYTKTIVEDGGTLTQEADSTLQTTGDPLTDEEAIVDQVAVPGESSTTFTVGATQPTLADQYAEWLQLYDHEKYAGNYYQDVGINHTPHFREQLAEDATISSLLIKIKPNSDLNERGIRPIWGLITGMTGNRNTTLSNWILTVEVLVLSVGEKYNTYEQIRTDLEV